MRNVDVTSDSDCYRKIEKAHVQQQEIIFHLQRLNRMMQLYVDSSDCHIAEIKNILMAALERVKDLTGSSLI